MPGLSRSHVHSHMQKCRFIDAHNLLFTLQSSSGFQRLFFFLSSSCRTYRLHRFCMYRNCSPSDLQRFTAYHVIHQGGELSLPSPSFSVLSSFFIHPERYLIARSFMCGLRCRRVKAGFCFFRVMTIAAAILMMW